MSSGVLFDAPGPHTRMRHLAYTIVTVLVLVAVVGFAVYKLGQDGQFDGDKWEVFVTPDYVRVLFVDGLLQTLKMAGAAIVGAIVLGFLLGVGKLSDHGLVRWPCWAVVELGRALPVLLMMVFVWYFLGIADESSSFRAVVIALTVYNGSVLAEILRAGVLAVPKGQAEAAYALGMRKSQVMTIVLMPQAVKIMIPALISQCVVALKDTALGAYVAAPGLTYVSEQIYTQFNNRVPSVFVVASLYIIINLVLTTIAAFVQRRYVGERKQLEVLATGTADQTTV